MIRIWRVVASCVVGVCGALVAAPLCAQQTTAAVPQADTDHDGLSDALEQRLLVQFMPRFMIGEHDCSVAPAAFRPEVTVPEVEADDGTIYGQVFPVKQAGGGGSFAELHYYHLWRRDCGGHGHALDTEHVAVLVRASEAHVSLATWKAVSWYAGAHENTVCDVSQIARASTLQAEEHGATVWISPGKHASYLNETLCRRGCGADRCEQMVPLQVKALINVGEADVPMNGALFTSSPAWPLQAKMSASNFSPAAMARLETVPVTDIAWVHAGRHPAQGIIARSSSTEEALANSGRDTTSAISVAGGATGDALSTAQTSTGGAIGAAGDSTGDALQKSYRKTRRALGSSARHVGRALHLAPEAKPQD